MATHLLRCSAISDLSGDGRRLNVESRIVLLNARLAPESGSGQCVKNGRRNPLVSEILAFGDRVLYSLLSSCLPLARHRHRGRESGSGVGVGSRDRDRFPRWSTAIPIPKPIPDPDADADSDGFRSGASLLRNGWKELSPSPPASMDVSVLRTSQTKLQGITFWRLLSLAEM